MHQLGCTCGIIHASGTKKSTLSACSVGGGWDRWDVWDRAAGWDVWDTYLYPELVGDPDETPPEPVCGVGLPHY